MIKIIILMGPDGCGKTTTKKALERATNYKYFVLDRLTDSIVYKKLFHRRLPLDSDILKFETKLIKIANVYLVYLTADTGILINRIRAKGDKETFRFIAESKDLFENFYLKKTYFKHITLDTGENNIETIIKQIKKFIK